MRLPAAVAVLCSLLLPLPGLAQRGGTAPPPRPAAQEQDGSRSRTLRDAHLLVRQGKFEDALSLLAGLRPEESSTDIVLLQGLCLRKLGRHDDACSLFRKEADALAARGEDPTPILVELERVYRELKDPQAAFGVCLEIHRGGGGAGEWVRDEMESLILADSLGERVVPLLQKEAERRPAAQDLRDLLVGAYLFLGRTDEALAQARALDRSRGAHGRVLMDHLRALDKRGMGQPVLDAADAAIGEGLKDEERQEALLLRAAALRRMKRFPEAVATCQQAAEAKRDGPLASVALRDRADLLVHELKNLDEGAKAYEALIASLEKAPVRERGKLLAQSYVALADCQLRMGRYEAAAEVLQRVEKQAPDTASREDAAFQQAEILFYAGKIDTAQAVYDRVVREFAGGDRVNDALERILLLTRCAGAGDLPLAALGQIAYQRRIGSPARGLEICQEAARACGDCPAAEDLMREQSLFLLDLGRIDEAAVQADTLAKRYADGSGAPALLRAIADRMRERDGESEVVLRRYEDLLTRFPNSHEAFEVRGLLSKLRTSGSLQTDSKEETQG